MMMNLPRCRHCGQPWAPPVGVVAAQSFCCRCSQERRQIATDKLGLGPLQPEDFDGPYLVPRALRVRSRGK